MKKFIKQCGAALVVCAASNVAVSDQVEAVIMNLNIGQCIDVVGAPGKTNGSRLQIWRCEWNGYNADNGTMTDQRWRIDNNGFIVNTLSGKCIDVAGAPGTGNNAAIQLHDCEFSGKNPNGTTTDQKWKINNGFLVNVLSNKCIMTSWTDQAGSKLQLYPCDLNATSGAYLYQRWTFAN